jgi:hypothetical protein
LRRYFAFFPFFVFLSFFLLMRDMESRGLVRRGNEAVYVTGEPAMTDFDHCDLQHGKDFLTFPVAASTRCGASGCATCACAAVFADRQVEEEVPARSRPLAT